MNLIISNQAIQDLEMIWEYTNNRWSLSQADKYIDQIWDKFEAIADQPYSGKSYNALREGYYGFIVGSHIIFYKLNVSNEEVSIIRILHQKMDLDIELL